MMFHTYCFSVISRYISNSFSNYQPYKLSLCYESTMMFFWLMHRHQQKSFCVPKSAFGCTCVTPLSSMHWCEWGQKSTLQWELRTWSCTIQANGSSSIDLSGSRFKHLINNPVDVTWAKTQCSSLLYRCLVYMVLKRVKRKKSVYLVLKSTGMTEYTQEWVVTFLH